MIVDASTRGRRNRVKGASCERDVAKWLKPWFPEACRAIRSTYPDPGDIALTAPGLFWSVKNCQVEQVDSWMAELEEKRHGALGLLVVRRKGHASPGEWWCWLRLWELLELAGADGWEPALDLQALVRMELRDVMPLLVAANYAKGSES
jgi:hypothetical protein